MGQLLTATAAIEYLRDTCGCMSRKTFQAEVTAGRIPVKPYGKKYMYRQEDLDAWQNITKPLSEYSNVAKSGTRISRSSQMDAGLSFANLLAARKKTPLKNIAHNAYNK